MLINKCFQLTLFAVRNLLQLNRVVSVTNAKHSNTVAFHLSHKNMRPDMTEPLTISLEVSLSSLLSMYSS